MQNPDKTFRAKISLRGKQTRILSIIFGEAKREYIRKFLVGFTDF